jgi:hypothetical protein
MIGSMMKAATSRFLSSVSTLPRVAIQRGRDPVTVGQQVLERFAMLRRADAHGRDRIAVVRIVDGDELAASGIGHGILQRPLDRFGAAGRAIRHSELAGCHAGEHPGELCPRAVQVVRMDVIRTIELPHRRENLSVSPAQVPDTPAHHEIDVLAAAGVDEMAVGGVADDDVPGFAVASEVLPVEFAKVHWGSTRAVRGSIGDARSLSLVVVGDLEQHVAVARSVERAPAREVQAPEFGAHMLARELRAQLFIGEVAVLHGRAESRYRRGDVGNAGRTDDKGISPPRAAVHLPGAGGHAPTLLPAELDARGHAMTLVASE